MTAVVTPPNRSPFRLMSLKRLPNKIQLPAEN
jgi:hypothetical protein